MAKRGKQNRTNEEWLARATGEQRWLQNWEQWKRYLGSAPGRRKKRKPAGDQVTGLISFVTGVIVTGLALGFSVGFFIAGEAGPGLALLLMGVWPCSVEGGGRAFSVFEIRGSPIVFDLTTPRPGRS